MAFGQAPVPQSSQTGRGDYPRLIQAQVPLYPPLALTAHIKGNVTIRATILNGRVDRPEVVHSSSPFLANPSVANLQTWQFVAVKQPIRLLVTYHYRIAGAEAKPQTETSTVEMDLPTSITITARPIKPTVTHTLVPKP